MSLVYPAADPQSSAPMTHALVVGVGHYYHLPGGFKYAAEPAMYTLGLKQLSSPPLSAPALANWLIEHLPTSHKNPKAPLGTVELLLSPQDYKRPDGKVIQVDAASFDNLEAAFNTWVARCDRNADNIGLFYFCGHGFEWDKQYLLPADYGAKPYKPWENVIDFNLSRDAFLVDCKATTMLTLLDACREVKIDTLTNLGFQARPLRSPSAPSGGPRDARVLKAALFGEQAHSVPNKVSYFTQALLECLARLGAAGPPAGSVWKVDTSSLGLAMLQLLARTPLDGGGTGACEFAGTTNTRSPTVLHTLPGVADALAEVTCDPEGLLRLAELAYRQLGSAAAWVVRQALAEPWKIEVPAGTYDLEARLPGVAKRQLSRQVVYPPFTPCVLT
jgi:hypothetical protein